MPIDIPLGTETAGYTITIDGRTYRPVLVDASGHPQVDVLASALPSGAATLAEQQTQTTALQLIDDLRNALAAVAADELRISDPRERNPVRINKAYRATGVAPHGFTERWTYTVPANKKAIVELISITMTTDAAPSSAGFAQCNVAITPKDGSETFVMDIDHRQQTLGESKFAQVMGALWLSVGDTIRGGTQDGATGGSIRYFFGMAATEFDA